MLFYVQSPLEFTFDPPFLATTSPRTILELGSGTGVVAAAVARVVDQREDLVIATDLPEVCIYLLRTPAYCSNGLQVCPLLDKNLRISPNTLVRPLAWGDENTERELASELFSGLNPRTLTYIICSDLVRPNLLYMRSLLTSRSFFQVYFPELFAPLLRSLIQLTSSMFVRDLKQTKVIIFHKVRSLVKEAPFWSAFGLWFDFTPILVKMKDQGTEDWRRFDEDTGDILLAFVARRRTESFKWQVPTDNRALLAGLGAWDNDKEKGDDSFESLLLMSLETS